MKILVAEDDQRLGKLIQDYLMPESEIVDIVNTGNDIQAQLAANTYDVLILDVMLPQKNGIDICRELRAENIDIAILFITALNNQNDKIRAFESGADDYLTKPLDFQELLLRVKALVRREKKTQTITLQWGKLVMIPTQKKVYIQNQELSLTPTEFKILNIFLEHPQQVFDTDNIIDKLWDLDHIPTQNTLRSHIKSLRKKLSYAGLGKDFIETVYGLGYKLKEQKESFGESTSNQKQSEGKKSRKPVQKTINPSDKLEALIEQVWLDNQNSISKDCQDLADYLNQKNQLIKTEQAIRIAHNLAGFLGSVGLEESGKIAKEIENLFTNNSDHLTNKKIVNNLNQLINDLEKKLFPQGKPNISTESTQNIEIKQPVNILVIDEDQNLANKLILFIEHPQINLYFSHSIESALTYLEEKKNEIDEQKEEVMRSERIKS